MIKEREATLESGCPQDRRFSHNLATSHNFPHPPKNLPRALIFHEISVAQNVQKIPNHTAIWESNTSLVMPKKTLENGQRETTTNTTPPALLRADFCLKGRRESWLAFNERFILRIFSLSPFSWLLGYSLLCLQRGNGPLYYSYCRRLLNYACIFQFRGLHFPQLFSDIWKQLRVMGTTVSQVQVPPA